MMLNVTSPGPTSGWTDYPSAGCGCCDCCPLCGRRGWRRYWPEPYRYPRIWCDAASTGDSPAVFAYN